MGSNSFIFTGFEGATLRFASPKGKVIIDNVITDNVITYYTPSSPIHVITDYTPLPSPPPPLCASMVISDNVITDNVITNTLIIWLMGSNSFIFTGFEGATLRFASPKGKVAISKATAINTQHSLPDQLKQVLRDPHIIKVSS